MVLQNCTDRSNLDHPGVRKIDCVKGTSCPGSVPCVLEEFANSIKESPCGAVIFTDRKLDFHVLYLQFAFKNVPKISEKPIC